MRRSRRECLLAALAAVAVAFVPTSLVAGGAHAPLRVGLWGCNPRGLALAVSALRASTAVELHAIADPDPGRAARAAHWWRNPAHRAALRERVRIDDTAVLAGADAAHALAAWPLDAVLLADPHGAPPEVLLDRHACMLAGTDGQAELPWLHAARVHAKARGHVIALCPAPSRAAFAPTAADQRAHAVAAFLDTIERRNTVAV